MTFRSGLPAWMVLVLVVILAGSASAASYAETHTVSAGPFRVEVALSGVFEAKQMTQVSLAPQEWREMVVTWAVEPGTEVKQGDVLLKLDTTAVDRAIKDIETGQALADLAFEQAREELRMLEKTTPEELEWERRSRNIAHEEFDYYMKRDFPLREKYFEFKKWGDRVSWDSVKLEHDELTRMYTADDLVETTEKVVLEQQKLRLARIKLGHELTMKFDYPRTVEVHGRQDGALHAR